MQYIWLRFRSIVSDLLFLFVLLVEPSDKSVEIMRKFSEQYARKSGTYFCVDKGVTSVVIKVFFFFSVF